MTWCTDRVQANWIVATRVVSRADCGAGALCEVLSRAMPKMRMSRRSKIGRARDRFALPSRPSVAVPFLVSNRDREHTVHGQRGNCRTADSGHTEDLTGDLGDEVIAPYVEPGDGTAVPHRRLSDRWRWYLLL